MSRRLILGALPLILVGGLRAEDFGEQVPASKADVNRLERKIDALTAAVDKLTAVMTTPLTVRAPAVAPAPRASVREEADEVILVPRTPTVTYTSPAPVTYRAPAVAYAADPCAAPSYTGATIVPSAAPIRTWSAPSFVTAPTYTAAPGAVYLGATSFGGGSCAGGTCAAPGGSGRSSAFEFTGPFGGGFRRSRSW